MHSKLRLNRCDLRRYTRCCVCSQQKDPRATWTVGSKLHKIHTKITEIRKEKKHER